MKKGIVQFIGIVILAVLFVWIFFVGISRHEVYECQKWAEEAEEYDGYFIREWQKGQCSYRGIEIDAPVKWE